MTDIILKDIKVAIGKKVLTSGDIILTKHIYFIVSPNGTGKTTILTQLHDRTLPLSKSIDTFLVNQEMKIDLSKTVYQIVAESNRDMVMLQQRLLDIELLTPSAASLSDALLTPSAASLSDALLIESDDVLYAEYCQITNTLQAMDHTKDESIIRKLLHKMGFDLLMQNQPVKLLSGGWRMRVNLARGLYMKPLILLLDEPTNHLDLETTIWVMDEIKKYPHKCLIVSHDINFMNACADCIMAICPIIKYYNGNYDHYVKIRQSDYEQLLKNYNLNQKQITNAKKKGKKVPANLPAPQKLYVPKIITFGAISIPHKSLSLTNHTIKYGDKMVLDKLVLDIVYGMRLAIIGKNGCGKSSILTDINKMTIDANIKVGYYQQHLIDVLPTDISAVDFLKSYDKSKNTKQIRQRLGSIGLESSTHLRLLSELSGGQRSRVLLAKIIAMNP